MTETQEVVVFGEAEERTRAQLARCLDAEAGSRGVLCADNHPGYAMPIGGVAAYRAHVSPNGVGYDIACGNCAVRTNLKAKYVDVAKVMDEIWRVLSFGMGQKNDERIEEHPVYESINASPVREQAKLLAMARNQLGTIGGGNHYVDLFEDRADGALWIGVHFGSRGLGHKTASGFLALAVNKEWGDGVNDDMDAPPTLIGLDTPLGQDYLTAMAICGDYAYAGRDWVVGRVMRLLGAVETHRVHNHHNYAWYERHHGEYWMVVRKGATPAFPGQQGFVGGTMGEDAVILEGVDSPASQAGLYSTVHGAGRVMGRREAAGVTRVRKVWKCGQRACPIHETGVPQGTAQRGKNGELPKCPTCGAKMHQVSMPERLREGKVNWALEQEQVRAKGIELRGAGADEAPVCYKRLPEVLAAHAGTIRILHQLRVIGVAMAGDDIVDPFRD